MSHPKQKEEAGGLRVVAFRSVKVDDRHDTQGEEMFVGEVPHEGEEPEPSSRCGLVPNKRHEDESGVFGLLEDEARKEEDPQKLAGAMDPPEQHEDPQELEGVGLAVEEDRKQHHPEEVFLLMIEE